MIVSWKKLQLTNSFKIYVIYSLATLCSVLWHQEKKKILYRNLRTKDVFTFNVLAVVL